MCCHLVQNMIDCFQMQDVSELPETTDSRAGLVDNVDEFDVEQGAQEEASQNIQERAGLECKRKRVLNVTIPYPYPKGNKKKNALHGQLSSHSSMRSKVHRMFQLLSLYKISSKEWLVVFAILKQAQKSNCIVIGEGKNWMEMETFMIMK